MNFEPKSLEILLNTPAWRLCFKPDHKVLKLLASLPNCTKESLNFTSVLSLALLLCPGDDEDLGEAFFQIVNPTNSEYVNLMNVTEALLNLFEIACNITY